MIQKDNSDIEQSISQTSLLLHFILGVLNSNNSLTYSTVFKFTLGINEQYYDIDDATDADYSQSVRTGKEPSSRNDSVVHHQQPCVLEIG
jgi:hypothetical protein